MTQAIQTTAEKIRKLEVQGARNVAIAAIEALQTLAEQTKAKNKNAFLTELKEAKDLLFATRETEPLMRNAITWVITKAQDSDTKKVSELGQIVASSAEQFLSNLKASRECTAKIGAKRIHNNDVIFTHCHSSTVTRLLEQAKDEGKNFKVICTETRPALQGRITAKEMANLGVETTFIVDSAARSFMGDVDIVMVGADAITSEGDVINKIGTSTIAVIANEARKPFYVVTELLKFDSETLFGNHEKIEQRNPKEVWKEAPKELLVKNPAFDVTPNKYIHGFICEEGVIAPQSIVEVVHGRYPWVLKRP